jgi:peroxiredoxin
VKKKVTLVIVLAVLAAVGALFFAGQQGGKRAAPVREGDPAPEFRLTALNGQTVSLASLRGKVVMVHFWATWCPPCVEELPVLDQMYRSLFGSDLEVLAVSVDEGGPEGVGAFIQRNRISLPVLRDPDHAVANSYGTFKFPETYLVDRQGVVRKKIIGALDWSRPEAAALVRELLDSRQ